VRRERRSEARFVALLLVRGDLLKQRGDTCLQSWFSRIRDLPRDVVEREPSVVEPQGDAPGLIEMVVARR
jgi:hypothetical protein